MPTPYCMDLRQRVIEAVFRQAGILALIAKQSDLTLQEIMAKQGIAGSRSALQRFFNRHNASFQKSVHAAEQKRAD